jgi:hypothetical protein
MRAVPLCGPRVVSRLESIGVERLADLRDLDPCDLMEEANIEAGRPIWRPPMAIRALENLVEAARTVEPDRTSVSGGLRSLADQRHREAIGNPPTTVRV